MSIRKGTQFTDASGNLYTVTSFIITKQLVKYTLVQPGQEEIPGQLSLKEWKTLIAKPSELEPVGIVNKAPKPGNGAAAVAPQKLTIVKGMAFEMMDKSRWKISEYNRILKKLVAVNIKTEKTQDFTLDQLAELVNDGHIKIIS